MAFPLKHLELGDIGRRVRVVTKRGAVIEDVLVAIHARMHTFPGGTMETGIVEVSVETEQFNRHTGHDLTLDPDSNVQYADE